MKLFNFGKKETDETEEKEERRVNPNGLITIRAVAVLYLLYMLKDTVSMYIKGGEEAPSVWMLLLCIVVLGGGAVWIAIVSFKQWKKLREEERLAAEEAERLEEEAAALEAEEDLEEDADWEEEAEESEAAEEDAAEEAEEE